MFINENGGGPGVRLLRSHSLREQRSSPRTATVGLDCEEKYMLIRFLIRRVAFCFPPPFPFPVRFISASAHSTVRAIGLAHALGGETRDLRVRMGQRGSANSYEGSM
jgi:hypothetical protein